MSSGSSGYSSRPARSKRAVSAASFASTEADEDLEPSPSKRRLTEIELEPRVDSGGDPAIRKAERKLRNRLAAQASRDRKAQAAQELETKVAQLEAALKANQTTSPTPSSISVGHIDSQSPRVALLEHDNHALQLELRIERAASVALRQRLEGLEKQFAQLEQLLAKPAPTSSWLQQLPPLPTPTSLAPATPAPASFDFGSTPPQSLLQPQSPISSMSLSSNVVSTGVDETQIVTPCSNAAGGNASLSTNTNQQLDFNFIHDSSTESASGTGSHQATADTAGQVDPHTIDDATFAEIWSEWTQSLPDSATGPAFELNTVNDQNYSDEAEGGDDLFAYLQESAFQEANQLAAF